MKNYASQSPSQSRQKKHLNFNIYPISVVTFFNFFFQEAKYICLAQIISIIVLTAFVPAYFTSRGLWESFSVGMATQICASSILILIFFKKVNIIILYPERNKVVLSKELLKVSSTQYLY